MSHTFQVGFLLPEYTIPVCNTPFLYYGWKATKTETITSRQGALEKPALHLKVLLLPKHLVEVDMLRRWLSRSHDLVETKATLVSCS